MKKLYITLIALLAPLFVGAPVALAQVDISSDVCRVTATGERPTICDDIDAAAGATGDANPIYGNNGILTRAISLLSFVVGVAAVLVMIIAGIQMILSQGDPGKITKNRNQIIYAMVGLAVAALAQVIVQFVLNRL